MHNASGSSDADIERGQRGMSQDGEELVELSPKTPSPYSSRRSATNWNEPETATGDTTVDLSRDLVVELAHNKVEQSPSSLEALVRSMEYGTFSCARGT